MDIALAFVGQRPGGTAGERLHHQILVADIADIAARRADQRVEHAAVDELARIAGEYGASIMEISELCPLWDANTITSKLSCCMFYHFLGSRAKTLRDRG